MKCNPRTLTALLALAPAAFGFGQTNSRATELTVGDNAPAISVAKWVKGTPVDSFDKGKIYVVEFWATWCGPCKQSIPHLTELQKKFGDKATFIGVSAFENDWSGVEPFVKSEGDQMDYNVAMDKIANPTDREGDMAKNWMVAAHQNGIPTAFVVDRDGKIAWIGHPMELEQPLGEIVAGTFDRAKFASEEGEKLAQQEAMAKFEKQLTARMQAKDWDGALKTVDENSSKLPPVQINAFKLDIYARSADETRFSALGNELVAGAGKDDAGLLNQIAWMIVDPKATFKHRDVKLARAAAQRAVDLTKGEAAEIIDTLAWTYYWSGDKAKAIELENQAIAKSGPQSNKADLEASLATFSKK